MPRLNKVLRELNIGFDTAVDFFYSKYRLNITSINEVISDEQYEEISYCFKRDKALRTATDKKVLSLKTRKNPNPAPADFTEIEQQILDEVAASDVITPKLFAKNRKEKRQLQRKEDFKAFKSRNTRSKKLSSFIQHNKGKAIQYPFCCAICGTTHTSGYLYTIGNSQKEVCKFCVSRLTGKGKGTKLIYTPM